MAQEFKQILYDRGVERSKVFLTVNRISHPAYEGFSTKQRWKAYGYYQNEKIYVSVHKSKLPAKTPGYSWSYPGYKADLTAFGIVAHETGHHISMSLELKLSRCRNTILIDKEKPVTSYAPNEDEDFAETLKLFITNPDLLRLGRPLRWDYVTNSLGLYQVEHRSWEEVLAGAHPKFFAAARNWIK